MPEYTQHIERRLRMQAVQLLDASEAPWFAWQLIAAYGCEDDTWALIGEGANFTLTVETKDGAFAMRRGDYLARSHDYAKPTVASCETFRQKWEPDE